MIPNRSFSPINYLKNMNHEEKREIFLIYLSPLSRHFLLCVQQLIRNQIMKKTGIHYLEQLLHFLLQSSKQSHFITSFNVSLQLCNEKSPFFRNVFITQLDLVNQPLLNCNLNRQLKIVM